MLLLGKVIENGESEESTDTWSACTVIFEKSHGNDYEEHMTQSENDPRDLYE
jgi:hypothetical protein